MPTAQRLSERWTALKNHSLYVARKEHAMHLYLVLHNQSSKFLLQSCDTGLESTCHGVQIYRYERICILNKSLMSDLFIKSLHMIMKMNVEKKVRF